MTSVVLLVFAALLQAAPVAAASPERALERGSAPAPHAAAPDSGKVVCRRFNQTGSRLGGTTECATAAQWRERERDNGDYLRQAQSKAFQFSQH